MSQGLCVPGGGTPTPLAFQVHKEDPNHSDGSVLLLLFSPLLFS